MPTLNRITRSPGHSEKLQHYFIQSQNHLQLHNSVFQINKLTSFRQLN